jgi:diguanylate cyclase (GGDEF)-like protein
MRPQRIPFVDYFEEALHEILALGLTPAQVDRLQAYGLLALDNVTGYYEARCGSARIKTLRRAIQHVRQTGEQVFYVEMDLVNLGGLNAALGHTGANKIFAAVAGIVRRELSAAASQATFFRHGGDETSAFLIDTSAERIREAVASVRRQVQELARRHNLHDLPHAKRGHAGGTRGTGVHFGICELSPDHQDQPTRVFELADRELERSKEGNLANEVQPPLFP